MLHMVHQPAISVSLCRFMCSQSLHPAHFLAGNNEPQDDNNHGSVFAYLRSNHTSVVGMWPAAAERGAECYCVDSRTHGPTATAGDSSRGRQGNEGHDSRDGDADFFVVNSVGGDDEDGMRAKACGTAQNGRTHANGHGEEDGRVQQERLCLFAYPAQCNFSGTRYPLEWVRNVQVCGSHCSRASSLPLLLSIPLRLRCVRLLVPSHFVGA